MDIEGGGNDEVKLSKTALRIYLYLLNKGREAGPREIAKDLGISPSLVHYHLKRLEALGLVMKGADGYRIASMMKLEGFLSIGRRLVPRMYIYASFFAGLLVSELIAVAKSIVPLSGSMILSIVSSLIGFVITFVEGYMMHRRIFKLSRS